MPFPPLAHGTLRGSDDLRQSRTFEGRFGRMFRSLPRASYADPSLGIKDPKDEQDLLKELAKEIEKSPGEPKEIQKGAVNAVDNSGIPAGYTYFGQFIDHDLTFDPVSSLQRS